MIARSDRDGRLGTYFLCWFWFLVFGFGMVRSVGGLALAIGMDGRVVGGGEVCLPVMNCVRVGNFGDGRGSATREEETKCGGGGANEA
jgi:hypothetical protein